MLVQMERQIDREIAADNKANGGVALGTQTENDLTNSISVGTENLFDTDSDDEDENNEPVLMYGPQPQIITNDLKSLDEMVSTIDLIISFYCKKKKPVLYSIINISRLMSEQNIYYSVHFSADKMAK